MFTWISPLLTRCRDSGKRGGVGLFVKDNINYKIRDDLSTLIPLVFESICIEFGDNSKTLKVVGV